MKEFNQCTDKGGEFGIYPTIPEDSMLRLNKNVYENFTENNIAYCHWCYKGDFPDR
jgi:hypothetical protein